MSIHTFGESHSVFGWNKCNNVKTHSIGPTLAYSFGRDGLSRCNITNYGLKNYDSVVFCFGEIDCRCHIHKYITADNTYENIIDNIINNYTNAIKINIKNCNVKLKNIGVYNVVPPVKKAFVETWKGAQLLAAVKEWPFLGLDEERKNYVLYFNSCLKQKCLENNWTYIDIYNKYVDENGYLNISLSDGLVHIDNPIFLQDFLNEHFK